MINKLTDLNRLIDTIYEDRPTYIRTNFILLHDNNPVLYGFAEIIKGSDEIYIEGDYVNVEEMFGLKNNITKININDMPKYYSCNLIDFPNINRRKYFDDKYITIELYKVLLNSEFHLRLSNLNDTLFSGSIIPLYCQTDDGIQIANICAIDK